MFSNRRQLRRWAARVLLLWLFGVSVGVANACWAGNAGKLGGLHLPLVAVADATQAEADLGLAECELHATANPQELEGAAGHLHSGSQTICHAYCDMSALSASPVKPSLDISPGPALPAPAYAFALTLPGETPVHLLKPRRDGGLAPPITIAFLRLTL